MATGCQGPFVNGSGGWCGCDCRCCPPEDMITCVLIVYGPPPEQPMPMTQGSFTADHGLELPGPPQEMPSFERPSLSFDGRFIFGGPAQTCSVPCEAFNVRVTPGGPTPLCGFQYTNGEIIAVGNGHVTADPIDRDVPGCGTLKVQINGQDPPVFVNDGGVITVTLFYEDPWNSFCCECIEILEVPGCYQMAMLRPMGMRGLLKRSMKAGKPRINPTTGLPMIVMDKKEIIRRLQQRQANLRRHKK
jgi:hypothetical protein